MAVMYLRKNDGKLEEIGRTEVILNNLSPKWIEKITVSFQFETVQTLVYATLNNCFLMILLARFNQLKTVDLHESFFFSFHVFDVDTRFHNVPVKVTFPLTIEFLNCLLIMNVTPK